MCGVVASDIDGVEITDGRAHVLFDNGFMHHLDVRLPTCVRNAAQCLNRPPAWQPKPLISSEGLSRPHNDHVQFVTFVTNAYHHWLSHLHLNLYLLGFSNSSLTVCSPQAESIQFSLSRGLKVVRMSSPSTANTSETQDGQNRAKAVPKFGSKDFRELQRMKQSCIWESLSQLPKGGRLLVLDGDLTILKDPLPWIQMQGEHDLVIQDDTVPEAHLFSQANVGFFLLRNTQPMRAFGNLFMKNLEHARGKANDQDVFNNVLAKHGATIGIRWHFLDPTIFPHGQRYYEGPRRYRNFSKLIIVHHNWISGDLNKWRRTVHYGGILTPGMTLNALVASMRRGAKRLPCSMECSKQVVLNQNTIDEADQLRTFHVGQ